MKSLVCIFGLSVACLGASRMAVAQTTMTWTGGAADRNWSNAANWNTGVPGAADTARFSASTAKTPKLGGDAAVGALVFSSGTDAESFTGTKTLTVNAVGGLGLDNQTGLIQTFGNKFALGADQTWQSTAASGGLTFNGAVNLAGYDLTLGLALSGASTITLAGNVRGTASALTIGGNGTVILTATGSYTGATTVNNGATLQIAGSGTLASSTAMTVNAGGTYDLNGINDTIATIAGAGNITLGSAKLTTSGNASTTYSGMLADGGAGGSLVKGGSGVLVLSGANAFSGGVVLNDGAIEVGHNSALGTGAVRVAAGAKLELQGGHTVANALTLAGTGSGVLDGALVNTGGTNTVSGTLTLAADTRIQSGGETLNLAGNIGGAGRTVTFGGAGEINVTGIIATGGGGLGKEGAGTLRLGAPGGNQFTGPTVLSAGSIVADAANVFNNSAAFTLSSGGVFSLNGFAQTIGSLNGGGTLDLGASGTGSLTLTSGSGTFSGTFGGSGTVVIGPGATLTLGADFNAPNLNFTLAGGTLALNGTTSTFGTLHLTGTSILDFGNSLASVLTVSNLTFQQTGLQLTIANWVGLSDFYYAQNFTGAVPDLAGFNPQNQVSFTGFAGNSTVWQSWDRQITPTPEPATYGGWLLSLSLSLVVWRQCRPRRTRAGEVRFSVNSRAGGGEVPTE